jgi:hypothetical protein
LGEWITGTVERIMLDEDTIWVITMVLGYVTGHYFGGRGVGVGVALFGVAAIYLAIRFVPEGGWGIVVVAAAWGILFASFVVTGWAAILVRHWRAKRAEQQ